MQKDIKTYFEQTVISLIAEKYPEVASEMSIQIAGSYGLGIADQYSDLDSVIWLDDGLWKRQGGQVQLMLQHCPQKFLPDMGIHCEICVWPLSWLRERGEFLEDKDDLPWEKVTFEELFEIQENLIIRDPHGLFRKLREATAPERFPDQLWKKKLILEFKKLMFSDLSELESTVNRDKALESQIIFGCVLEDLMHLGFIINRRYYPWRKHLRWAFERLPILASDVLPDLNAIISSYNWGERIASIESIVSIYREHIAKSDILPEIDILATDLDYELTWAERCEAWSNPNWRDWIVKCGQKAKEAGHDESDFWIWSLWGWAK